MVLRTRVRRQVLGSGCLAVSILGIKMLFLDLVFGKTLGALNRKGHKAKYAKGAKGSHSANFALTLAGFAVKGHHIPWALANEKGALSN